METQNIRLKRIEIENFKGITHTAIEIEGNIEIHGANATGKTSIFDAFTWLLFNKNSHDNKEFNTQPIDSQGTSNTKVDTRVKAILYAGDREIELEKVKKTKWTKKKGSPEASITGTEVHYWIDKVPMKLKDYNLKMADIIEESKFKILTNPSNFNNLKMETKREILENLIQDFSSEELLESNPEYEILKTELQHNTIEELNAKYGSQKRKLIEELKEIPVRIDQETKRLPEDKPWERIKEFILKKDKRVTIINDLLADQNKQYSHHQEKINEAYDKKRTLIDKKNTLLFEAGQKANEKTNEAYAEINRKNTEASRMKNEIENLYSIIQNKQNLQEKNEEERDVMRWEFRQAKQLEWVPIGGLKCPTCDHPYDQQIVDDLNKEKQKEFNQGRADKIADISSKGKKLKEEHDNRMTEIIENTKRLDATDEKLTKVLKQIKLQESQPKKEVSIPEMPEVENIEKEINQIDVWISKNKKPQQEDVALKKEREININEMQELKIELSKKGDRDAGVKEIKMLESKMKNYAQQIADIEKKKYTAEDFIMNKINTIENLINGKFENGVSFKLFKTQINEGTKMICDTLVYGVPYKDVNTAGKINAGLEIIDVLSQAYKTTAPIFIDNAESITKIKRTTSQQIKLVVNPEAKKLEMLNISI